MGLFIGANISTQFDPDAGAFINATGIGGIEAVAINNLVQSLKVGGLWTNFLAIYPMVGGTANTHKYNLKNPQDTDAAYRLSFQGTWTHSSSGALPNGAAGTYANTFLNQTTAPISTTNGHISYNSFSSVADSSAVEIGAGFSGGADVGESLLAIRFSNTFYVFWAHSQAVNGGGGVANTTTTGFYLVNRAAATEGWQNGTRTVNTGNGNRNGNYTFYLGAQNDGTGNFRNSAKGCSFASIGNTLPTGGAAALTLAVQSFQRTLNRI